MATWFIVLRRGLESPACIIHNVGAIFYSLANSAVFLTTQPKHISHWLEIQMNRQQLSSEKGPSQSTSAGLAFNKPGSAAVSELLFIACTHLDIENRNFSCLLIKCPSQDMPRD